MDNLLNFVEYKPPRGFQGRSSGFVSVTIGRRLRHCYGCNRTIPKGESHVCIDGHLSSGYRSNVNICSECITRLYVKLWEKKPEEL